jgi:hypothetical protein
LWRGEALNHKHASWLQIHPGRRRVGIAAGTFSAFDHRIVRAKNQFILCAKINSPQDCDEGIKSQSLELILKLCSVDPGDSTLASSLCCGTHSHMLVLDNSSGALGRLLVAFLRKTHICIVCIHRIFCCRGGSRQRARCAQQSSDHIRLHYRGVV